MRFLGLDIGDKRTGLAIADLETTLVSPIRLIEAPLARTDELIAAIARAVDEYKPDALVVGLPIGMDDQEGPQAKKIRAFAQTLASRLALPIHLHDERLSTDAAHWRMAGTGLTHAQKKQRRDALAAAAILRDYLGTISPHPPPQEP